MSSRIRIALAASRAGKRSFQGQFRQRQREYLLGALRSAGRLGRQNAAQSRQSRSMDGRFPNVNCIGNLRCVRPPFLCTPHSRQTMRASCRCCQFQQCQQPVNHLDHDKSALEIILAAQLLVMNAIQELFPDPNFVLAQKFQ